MWIAVASFGPIQIGSTRLPSISWRMTTGLFDRSSMASPPTRTGIMLMALLGKAGDQRLVELDPLQRRHGGLRFFEIILGGPVGRQRDPDRVVEYRHPGRGEKGVGERLAVRLPLVGLESRADPSLHGFER